jgi:hypothetical protein
MKTHKSGLFNVSTPPPPAINISRLTLVTKIVAVNSESAILDR